MAPTTEKMTGNKENAQLRLIRFITMKNEERKKPKVRCPLLASECWRQQIVHQIGFKVTQIQNEGLGENRRRDLNDEINKLIHENLLFERRIIELGGPNYSKHSVDVLNPSYRYFGAAKKLPGVREDLLELQIGMLNIKS